MIIAAVVIPNNTSTYEEKGTLPPTYMQEMHKYLEIDRSIEFVREPIISTPSPTPTPEPTPPKSTETPIPTPIPTPEPTPYVYVSSTPATIYDAICNQGLAWDCQQALNIAWCESGWKPWTVSWAGAIGLFQMMLPLHSALFDGDPYDPYVNSRAAYRLYSQTGNWSAWNCYPV